MADNYLERQREAYEARKAEWLNAKRCGKARKPARSSQGNESRGGNDAGQRQ